MCEDERSNPTPTSSHTYTGCSFKTSVPPYNTTRCYNYQNITPFFLPHYTSPISHIEQKLNKLSNSIIYFSMTQDLISSEACGYRSDVLECNVVSLDEWFPTFQKILQGPSSPRRECLAIEDNGNTFLQNQATKHHIPRLESNFSTV